MADKTAIIIGSGLGGLGAACILGKAGYRVTVLEKNDQLGGRAGLLQAEGFTFDTGPSWYLMPDIFEHFFELVGERVEDHLELVKLQPSYRVFYKDGGASLTMTGDLATDMATFESVEPGAGKQLQRYLHAAACLYSTATEQLLYKNYTSLSDLFSPAILRQAPSLKIFKNVHRHVRHYFQNPHLQQVMEYPAVFLGASPYNTPAFYSLLNHVVNTQGVYYPMGGIYKLVEALVAIGKKHGVEYQTDANVEQIIVADGTAVGVRTGSQELHADIVISNADPHHTHTALLTPEYREYSDRYWRRRITAPSALLMYLGVNKRYGSLAHHNLLFSSDWAANFAALFNPTDFPADPSLYVCTPSKTDTSVAPAGNENIFILVPLAAGLDYTRDRLHTYADTVLAAIETHMHLPALRQHVVYQKLFCVQDFASRLNSLRGTSLGLAHTLLQTAHFRPHNRSRTVRNLYHVGGNVHPGIGMPSTLISAELLYKHLIGDTSDKPLDTI